MFADSSNPSPILCAPLLRQVDEQLIDLLGSLTPGEWDLQTIAPLWKVRDVAAHLLDTVLRKLSMARDGCYVETVDIRSPQELIAFVNRLNREGVTVYRRLSPKVLIPMMREACEQGARFHESLDPFAPAAFAVSWAGETISLNWFDTARELTERWHHQQQIRDATERPGLYERRLFEPVMDTFVRALPWTFRAVEAAEGTSVRLGLTGACRKEWSLVRGHAKWELFEGRTAHSTVEVGLAAENAWKIFTKGIRGREARSCAEISGDSVLGQKVLETIAVIA